MTNSTISKKKESHTPSVRLEVQCSHQCNFSENYIPFPLNTIWTPPERYKEKVRYEKVNSKEGQ
jgi:hypothetical protein